MPDGTGAGPQPATNPLAAARESGGGVRSCCSAAGWENPLQSPCRPSPANAAEAGWRSQLGGLAFPTRVVVGLKVNRDAVCVCFNNLLSCHPSDPCGAGENTSAGATAVADHLSEPFGWRCQPCRPAACKITGLGARSR